MSRVVVRPRIYIEQLVQKNMMIFFSINGFRARTDGKSFSAKEFGNSFDETLDFANKSINSDKAAIIKVTIPDNVYNKLNHMNLDRSIFKSGTPVVEPEMLKLFNKSIIKIEHVF